MGILDGISSFFNKDKENNNSREEKFSTIDFIVFSADDVDINDYWGFLDEMPIFSPYRLEGQDYTNLNNTSNDQLRVFLKDLSQYLPPANASYGASKKEIEAKGIEYIGDTDYKVLEYGIEISINRESCEKEILGKNIKDLIFEIAFKHKLCVFDYALIIYCEDKTIFVDEMNGAED